MSKVYSLTNPPSAPKKRTLPLYRPWKLQGLRLPFPEEFGKARKARQWKRLIEEERAEYERWPIRRKFLRWTPMEIEEMNSAEELTLVYNLYVCPASQPHNSKEDAYLNIMRESILFRMLSLNIKPQ